MSSSKEFLKQEQYVFIFNLHELKDQEFYGGRESSAVNHSSDRVFIKKYAFCEMTVLKMAQFFKTIFVT